MCPALNSPLSFNTESWNAAFYGVMADAAKAVRDVHEKTRAISAQVQIPARLWKLERELRNFIRYLESPPDRSLATEAGPVVPDAEIAHRLLALTESLDSLYVACKTKGLTNRTLTGASLSCIRKHTRIIDNWGEAILNALPETQEKIDIALMEYADGKTVGLEAII